MLVRNLIHVCLPAVHRVTVDRLQDAIISPSTALHNIGIRDSQRMLDAGRVVPEIMKPKVRDPGALEDSRKPVSDYVRSERRYAPGNPFPPLCHEIGEFYVTVSGVGLRRFHNPRPFRRNDHVPADVHDVPGYIPAV